MKTLAFQGKYHTIILQVSCNKDYAQSTDVFELLTHIAFEFHDKS